MTAPREQLGAVPVIAGYVPDLVRLTASAVDLIDPHGGLLLLTPLVPAGHWWRVLNGRAIVSASANVSDRVLQVYAGAAGLVLWQAMMPAAQVASQVASYTFGLGYTSSAFTAPGGRLIGSMGLPDVLTPPGAVLNVNTGGADSSLHFGDSWSTAQLLVEDYVERQPAAGVDVDRAFVPVVIG